MTGISTRTEHPLERFYSEYFMFSYSSLNKLLHSAQLFYNWYILRERTDSLETHLVGGKVVHCLILEKELFNKNFVIMVGELPGVSNKKIVEAMYKIWKDGHSGEKLPEFEKEILQWMQVNNLHQSLKDDKDPKKADYKTADEKRMGKVLTSRSVEYFEYLKKSENKDVIDQDTFDKCEEAANAIRDNAKITELLQINSSGFELIEVFNENPLACQVQGLPFGLKGIVDNYVIDHTVKKVYINDLKTTGKTLREFRDSVDYYKYWMQAAIYIRLVKAQHPDISDYEFIFHFIVVDKYNQVYAFPVEKQSLLDWQSQLEEVLDIAKYHYTNKDYTLPYEFAMDQVTL